MKYSSKEVVPFGGVMAMLVGAAVLLAGGSSAQASPIWEYGGAPSSEMPFSARLHASGAEASYFNPAHLVDAGQGRVTFGTSVSAGRLRIEMDERPAGVDISDAIYDARISDAQGRRSPPQTRPLATDELPRQRGGHDPSFEQPYLTLGTAIPIVDERFTIGAYATVPADRFAHQQPHFVDEREQYFSNSLHFERFGDRMVGASFALAMGLRVTDWLRVGAGLTMAQDAASDNVVFSPDPIDQERSEVTTAVTIRTRAVPHLGLSAKPAQGWTVAATVHAPFQNRVDGENELRFWNFSPTPDADGAVRQQVTYVYDYEPLRVGAGLSRQWGDDDRGALLGGQLLYGRWSRYVDRQGQQWPEQWRDTLSPTLAGGWWNQTHRLHGELRFMPSAVEPQTGRTNFVDNSQWASSVGWSRQVELLSLPFRVGVQGQAHWLVGQRTVKEKDSSDPVIDEFPESFHVQSEETIEESLDFRTNNPGYPGYRTSGLAVGAGLFLESTF